MKAIQIQQQGDSKVMNLQEIAKPSPKSGEALVRLKASGVNFLDTNMRAGRYPVQLPYIPGLEGAGMVEEVNADTQLIKPGDRVAYISDKPGSYAEYQAVNISSLIPLPESMSFEQGAAFPVQGMTTHHLMYEYVTIKPNTKVLVHAAAGGTGLLLVQWLRHLKAEIFATVSTQEKARIAKAAGANHVILYSKQNFVDEILHLTQGQGVDYIIDGVGKSTFQQDLQAVKTKGLICLFGVSSGKPDPFEPYGFITRPITLCGGNLMFYLNTREEILQRANAVIEGLREGWLNIHIHKTLPLADAAEAHRMLESRESTGKIVLTIS